MRRHRKTVDLFVEIATGAIVLLFLFPVLYLILTSLKTQVDAFQYPPVWIFRPTFSNYREVFDLYPFGHFLVNSLIVASASTVAAVALGAMAAYALARFSFRRSKDVAFWILSIRMTPPVAAIIPIFILMRMLGLLDSWASLVIAYSTMNLPFATWLLRGFFSEIPRELDESALVDGCSWFSAFRRIALPLAAPGLVVTAIFVFIFSWNEFLFALILTATKAQTLPVAVTGFIRETGIMWGHMAAAGVIIMTPMVMFSLAVQRYMVRGLTMGAIK
ncbi:MAG TPA: carbohydrate ABC transporter permease [bacterium]|nr:carbohydrate ABC transporter permease [bacterium]